MSHIMLYEEYAEKVNKYLKTDNRELNYQNRVIIPLLESLLREKKDIEVVDTSTQYKNRESKEHTRTKYAGDFTPDILIASNWNYQNKKNNNIGYHAVMEIKIPSSRKKYQISEYFTKEVRKIIWTNCITWEFYESNIDRKIKSFTFQLEGNASKEYNDDVNWNDFCKYLVEFIEK